MSQNSPAIRYTPGSDILGHTAPLDQRAVVRLVRRNQGRASALTPIGPQAAIAALSHNRAPDFDLSPSARNLAEALASGGTFQLAVGSDLDAAVDLLRKMLESPAGDAARKR
jgi:hypothetical protein